MKHLEPVYWSTVINQRKSWPAFLGFADAAAAAVSGRSPRTRRERFQWPHQVAKLLP